MPGSASTAWMLERRRPVAREAFAERFAAYDTKDTGRRFQKRNPLRRGILGLLGERE